MLDLLDQGVLKPVTFKLVLKEGLERQIPLIRRRGAGTKQRIGQIARPLLDAAEAAQGGATAITVDKHQPFAANVGTGGNRHHNTRNDLAATLDRMGDPCHGARFHQCSPRWRSQIWDQRKSGSTGRQVGGIRDLCEIPQFPRRRPTLEKKPQKTLDLDT
jgi:hypothetical protein